jgi:hypothetical protein
MIPTVAVAARLQDVDSGSSRKVRSQRRRVSQPEERRSTTRLIDRGAAAAAKPRLGMAVVDGRDSDR